MNLMSDIEFDILDELYFIISFHDLLQKLQIEESVLKVELEKMYLKGWLRIMEKKTENPVDNLDSFNKNYKFYNYLASKEGLFAHNSL